MSEEVPICLCKQYWPGEGHHPECPVRREIVTLRSQLAAVRFEAKQWQEGFDRTSDDCAYLRHRAEQAETALTAMTEARDHWQREAGIQQAHRERDRALLDFLADDPPFDEFHGIDIYELWGEVAAMNGREEANSDDKREAFRLLLSRALSTTPTQDTP